MIGAVIGKVILSGSICIAAAAPAVARKPLPYGLDGKFIQGGQGGMVKGWTTPGSTALLDGKPIPVDKNRRFVFGFDHDHKQWSILVVQAKGAGTFRKKLQIKQRRYRIQRIGGLKKICQPETRDEVQAL